jgi:hypothetical protein
MQKYKLQKIPLKKKPKILQDNSNSTTDLKFQKQAKISSFKKSSYNNNKIK